MNSSRKSGIIFAAFVAICLLFFAYWMVSGLFGLDGKYLTGSDSGDNENSAGFASGQSSLGNDSVKFSYIDKNGNVSVSSADDVNFTALVATDISSEFVSKSKLSPQSEPSEILGKMSANDFVQNKLSDILKQSTVELVDDIPDTQLNIIRDSSKESVQKYVREYVAATSKMDGIIVSDSGDMTKIIDDAFQNQDYAIISQKLADIAAAIHALEPMQVPLPAVEFHKQSLMFLKNLSVFLSSIKTISADPLKAYLMMNNGVSLIEQQGLAATKAYQQLKMRYNI